MKQEYMPTFKIALTKADKQAKAVAQSILQGVSKEISITVKGNTTYLSGKVIKIEDSLTKLVDSFYIEEDEREWRKGQHMVTMKLKF